MVPARRRRFLVLFIEMHTTVEDAENHHDVDECR